ncbi:SWIM zinc finger family protein [Actinomyces culturomici]|uniref:SWIM zinc finger family protein n=1 Tax=Actinomyces culturomici TaxID=1926276 RepID=UPI000E20C0A7|nr:DUF6880 family protein [Actinomyces culturomici]
MSTAPHPGLSETALRLSAGDVVFARGKRYVDRVVGLDIGATSASAIVTGTHPYAVELLWEEEGAFEARCTCPHFDSGFFCKHLVAVGLAALEVLDGHGSAPSGSPDGAATEVGSATPDQVRSYIESLDRASLERLVLDMAGYSEEARTALMRTASIAAGDIGGVLDLLGQACSSLLSTRRGIDWREAMDFAREADALIEQIDALRERGYAKEILPLARKVLLRMQKMLFSNVDDSAGAFGSSCQYAWEVYARALHDSGPHGAVLGKWFAKFRLESPGWPDPPLAELAGALDGKGLAAYRKAVEKAHAESLAHPAEGYDYRASTIRGLRLELADLNGDVDAAVAILSETEYIDYDAIVSRLMAANREREAMSWVDRARARMDAQIARRAFNPLVLPMNADMMVDLYLNDGRGEEALEVAKLVFSFRLDPSDFDRVLRAGAELGVAEQARAWAVDLAEKAVRTTGEKPIALALHEGDVARAWEYATRWGAGYTWRDLVAASGPEHAAEAVALFRPWVLESPKQKAGREGAAEVVKRLKAMMKEAKRLDPAQLVQVEELALRIRSEYANRPRLLEALDRAGF